MPQPWAPSSQSQEKKDLSDIGLTNPQQQPSVSIPATSSSKEEDQKASPEGGGEMDWDMALDTILKTLRKDRVGDTK